MNSGVPLVSEAARSWIPAAPGGDAWRSMGSCCSKSRRSPAAAERALVGIVLGSGCLTARRDSRGGRREPGLRGRVPAGSIRGSAALGRRPPRPFCKRMGGHELLQAWLLNDLGSVYYLHGHKDGVDPREHEAIAAQGEGPGPEHPDVGMSEGNLAITLFGSGSERGGASTSKRSIALLSEWLGADTLTWRRSLSNDGEISECPGPLHARRANRSSEREPSGNVSLGSESR